jgi:hypothetical protein
MTPSELPPVDHPQEPLELTLEEALEKPQDAASPDLEEEDAPGLPGALQAAATAWADLILMLAVCSLAVAGARALGYAVGVAALPWAGILGVLAWVLAASALLVTRRSWPGALLLGLALPVEAGRERWRRRLVLLLLGSLSLGVLSILLSRFDPWGSLVPDERA